MKKFGLIFIVLVLVIGGIFEGNQIYQNRKNVHELQKREAKLSIITPGKFENLADTLTVKFRDYSMIRLIAEYNLNTFVYRTSKDLWLGQDQFIRLMKINITDQLCSNAFKLDVLNPDYSKKRSETIIQFFSDNTKHILENSNIQYPGAIETLKISVISKGYDI